eukprot:363570-Chlamydomonas_euryale.AAC.19
MFASSAEPAAAACACRTCTSCTSSWTPICIRSFARHSTCRTTMCSTFCTRCAGVRASLRARATTSMREVGSAFGAGMDACLCACMHGQRRACGEVGSASGASTNACLCACMRVRPGLMLVLRSAEASGGMPGRAPSSGRG